MTFRFPGLKLREPLRSHPIAGAIYGGLLGAFFGLLAPEEGFPAGKESILYGYSCGGLIAGLLIGAGIPLFRNRILAGAVVAVGASFGMGIASWFWEEHWGLELSSFLGAMWGFAYAALLWDYSAEESSADSGQES